MVGGRGGRGQRRRLGGVWEALTVAGLVAAFLAVAGLAGLTVYRLWSTSGSPGGTGSGSTISGTGSSSDSTISGNGSSSGGADSQEG